MNYTNLSKNCLALYQSGLYLQFSLCPKVVHYYICLQPGNESAIIKASIRWRLLKKEAYLSIGQHLGMKICRTEIRRRIHDCKNSGCLVNWLASAVINLEILSSQIIINKKAFLCQLSLKVHPKTGYSNHLPRNIQNYPVNIG